MACYGGHAIFIFITLCLNNLRFFLKEKDRFYSITEKKDKFFGDGLSIYKRGLQMY